MDIKQEFREEKNMDVYAINVNDGSFSNVYVKWLEAKLIETEEQLILSGVVSTSCDLTETELKNRIRLADIVYHQKKESS